MNNFNHNNNGNNNRRFQRNNFVPVFLAEKADNVEFMQHKELFAQMKPQLEQIATEIKKAINQKRRIFLKHHNDCDGYCSGIALDKAILPLIGKVNEKKQALSEKFKRMPSMSPFYSIEDVTKDIAQFEMLREKYDEKAPLVILSDLGSGPENRLPVKLLKLFGCTVIIIDHHPVDEEIKATADIHLNFMEYQTHEDSSLCAGILCAELGRMINSEVKGFEYIAAISAIGDRVIDFYAQPYLDAIKNDFSKEEVIKTARVMDFVSYNMRTLDGRELFSLLMGTDIPKQKAYVELMRNEMLTREQNAITQAKAILTCTDAPNITYITFPVSDMVIKDNYPRMGVIVELVNDDKLQSGTLTKTLATIGYTKSMFTCRAQPESPFNFPDLLQMVIERVPLAFAEGGGHPGAGSFKFAEGKFDEVFAVVKEYLEKL